ncbi:MAG TPA: FAD-binding domain [Gemmatimonadaceae bacterium]
MGDRSILISGAGIAGPTLAYWLLERGFAPTIVERAPALRTGGYMIDFWGVGYDVAERMGLLPDLHADGYRIDRVSFVDTRGHPVAGFAADAFRAPMHNRFVSLPRGDLARRAFERVEGRVEMIWGDCITRLEERDDRVLASFENAWARSFDAVIGADGLHSTVRSLAFDAFGAERFLGYYTAAFRAPAYPHRDADTYVAFSIPGGQVARYALRDGSSAFFFIVASNAPLTPVTHEVDAQRRLLRERFGGAGWECDEILECLDRADDLYFDAVAQIRLNAWSRGRIGLVGDAAFCPSLLSGQGSALAMAGAYVLAHAIGEHDTDIRSAFLAYEREFRPFVEQKQRSAKRFGSWLAPRTRLGIRLRDLGTAFLGLPMVGEALIARSVGDRFELPPLS